MCHSGNNLSSVSHSEDLMSPIYNLLFMGSLPGRYFIFNYAYIWFGLRLMNYLKKKALKLVSTMCLDIIKMHNTDAYYSPEHRITQTSLEHLKLITLQMCCILVRFVINVLSSHLYCIREVGITCCSALLAGISLVLHMMPPTGRRWESILWFHLHTTQDAAT